VSNAAPILEFCGMTACFFVSTAMIGSGLPFDHDIEQLGASVPAMTWDDVRRLVAAGHEIGSHTARHIDVSRTGAEDLRADLLDSVNSIEQHTGVRTRFLAFPFGRRQHTSEAAVACAREAGFACYCWAEGETNYFPLDPYHLRRCGPHWRMTTHRFLALLDGWGASSG